MSRSKGRNRAPWPVIIGACSATQLISIMHERRDRTFGGPLTTRSHVTNAERDANRWRDSPRLQTG